MAKTIIQKVVFKNTETHLLFGFYTNALKHAEATGSGADISAKAGAKFSVYGGYATGKNLHVEKNKLIVQLWRASDWKPDAPDSVFTILFEQSGTDAVLHVVHANVPDDQADALGKGWNDYYWKPWTKYLEKTFGPKKKKSK